MGIALIINFISEFSSTYLSCDKNDNDICNFFFFLRKFEIG